jgi:hypothetical protein
MFTAKDFNDFARLLKQIKPHDSDGSDIYATGRKHQWETTVDEIATLFELSNPRFDKERFLKVCGSK